MKRFILALLLLSLVLTGCSGPARDPSWEEDWIGFDAVLAVETPEGFTLQENQDALGPNGIYYASWTTGEGTPYENEDGEEVTLYEVQVYLLLDASSDPAGAMEDWMEREKQNYSTGETEEIAVSGQEFTILPLLSGHEGNPYAQGTAAFAVRGEWGICLEVLCTGDQDARQIADTFLNAFHYGTEAR